MKVVKKSTGFHGFHLLVDVDIKQTSLAVRQHPPHDVERVVLQLVGTFEAPTHHNVLCILPYDARISWHRDGFLGGELGPSEPFSGFPCAEILVNNSNRGIGIKVSCQRNSHIIRHIIAVEIVLDIDD